MRMFLGLDWASLEHAVCVVDESGAVRAQLTAEHSAAGLAELLAQLRRFGEPATLPIAIERPTGLLVDTLVDAGFPVYPVHPNVVKASRARYRAAGSKSDPHDAYVLADVLRTDGHRLRPLRPQRDTTRALRALVRGRDDLVATRVALANQLRALLESFWPGAAAIFADVASPIALAFLARYPTPQSAARLGPGAWPPSPLSTPTAGDARPTSCSPACMTRPRAARPPPRQPPRVRSSAPWSRPSRRWWPSSSALPPRWSMPSPRIPTVRSSWHSPALDASMRPRSLPKWGTIAPASLATTTSRPRPALPP